MVIGLGKTPADLRILVVEDDSASAKLLQTQLRHSFAGAHVTVAATCEQALSLAPVEHDVILLDLNLPDASGRETFDRIHRAAPLVPIILVTGVPDEELCDSLLRSGAQDYLVKGEYKPSDLKRAIRYAIDRQNLIVELARVRDDLRIAESESTRAASELRLRSAFVSTPVPAYLWQRAADDFECVDANPAAQRASAVARTLIGRRATDLVQGRPELLEAIRRARMLNELESVTVESRSFQDPSRPIAVTITAIRPDRLLTYVQDLSGDKGQREAAEYRNVLDTAPVGILVVDFDGRIRHVNATVASMLGYSQEELATIAWPQLLFPWDAPRLDVIRDRGALRREHALRRKDGSPVIADVSSVVVNNDHILMTSRDITDLRLMQQESAFQASLLANVQDAIIASDADDRIIYWNHAAERTYGWTAAEAIGRSRCDLHIPPDARDGAERALEIARESGHCEGEFIAVRKDGSPIPVFVSISAMHDTTGEFSGLVSVSFDRSEIKEKETLINAILENLPVGVWLIDKSGTIIGSNPEARRIWGGARYESLDSMPYKAWFVETGEQVTATTRPAYVTLTTHEAILDVEMEIEAFDSGAHRWIILSSVPVVTSSGEFVGVVVVNHDVTEKRAAQRSLEQANRVSGLGRLAATIAHEINNILMGIQPFAEVIRRKAKGISDLEHAADQILRSIRRGKTVTTEILRFTRPIQPHLAPLRLRDYFRSIEAELRAQLPESILFTLAARPNLSILADKDQLTQVFTNLVINARDAAPNAIDVIATGGDGEVKITVTDTGKGIDRDALGHIFEPLFTTKRNGTGLGLSVVQQIVTAHKGRIEVESELGQGTKFTLTFPQVTA